MVFSQKQANIWYFGDGAGLDFNTIPPSILLNGQTDFLLPIGWNESYSSISDSSGALLFYSDGVRVWNKMQNIMLNGNNLLGHRSSSMGCLIVPKPGSSRYFYIFTNDALENNFQNGLRYSIVDICGDSTKGEVISTAKNIPLNSLTSERLVSVKHSNGSDYWIISHKFNSNEFCAFLLTNAGIVDTVISNTGPIDIAGWGEMAISNNGQKISYCQPTIDTSLTSAFIADFNLLTGTVSNAQILSKGGREYATAFSPDNSKIYFSTTGIGSLFQYDLNSPNLATLIASKNFLFQNSPDQWRHMAHGPDGNIYISRTGKNYLSAIYNPNNLYPNCTYVDSAIYLGNKFTSHGLPNFIADFQYMNTIFQDCRIEKDDSVLQNPIFQDEIDLINGVSNTTSSPTQIKTNIENSAIKAIYPNPNNGSFNVHIKTDLKDGQFILVDILGRQVFTQKVVQGINYIKTTGVGSGLFQYFLFNDRKIVGGGKLFIE